MNDPLIPASTVLSCWTGDYISSFVDTVRLGLATERTRLQGRPYAVVASRHEYDMDGLTDYVDVLEAFSTEEQALIFARQGATEALGAALAAPTYPPYKWRQVDGWTAFFFPRREQPGVRTVGCERFHVVNGSGYNSIYVEYLALHITAQEVLGNELFAFLGEDYEAMSYLSKKGKAHSREP